MFYRSLSACTLCGEEQLEQLHNIIKKLETILAEMNQLKNPAAYVLGKRVLLALYRKLETPQKELLQHHAFSLGEKILTGKARDILKLSRKSATKKTGKTLQRFPCVGDFQFIKPISRGAYGKVYLCRKKQTEDLYAIKIMKKEELIRKNMVERVLVEKKAMCASRSPWIVKLYFAFQSKKHLFLVMEYLIGGDLASLLHVVGAFNEETSCFYISEVVLALDYLHRLKIVHRDVKPENMLIDKRGSVAFLMISYYYDALEKYRLLTLFDD
ncbi:serine/threonine-protein kinase greatwall-like [Zophobas morio]|uniref:serine/threonine-protein kinase greatwall-like n=1 Tax=Zophobas morio TaxID=2755281 RepID=UPI003082B151